MIRMPLRNSTSDKIAIAVSKCLFFACERHFNIIPLGNIAKVVSGGTPSTDNPFYWDGDIAWATPKDLGQRHDIEISNSERYISHEGLTNSSAKLLPIGTVLLSSRAPIGHLGIASIPLATNQGFKNIICSNQLNNRYLFHMLRANIDKLESLGRGNTFKEIPGRVVEELALPLPSIDIQQKIANFLDCVYKRLDHQSVSLPILPSPIEEQRRIAARIEELAAKIEEARRLRREAVEEVSNILAAFITNIFSGEKTSCWQEGKLEDYILDDCYGTSEKTIDDPTGVPILRMGNIQNGRILTNELKYLYLDDRDRDKQILQKGDILVNRTNSAELVGKCAVFDLEDDYGFASYIIRLRIDQTKANPWLIAAYINSPLGRKYIFQERTQMTGQANINAKKLKALPIKLPSSIEQQRIVETIDHLQKKIDSLKQQQAQTSTELNALLPSILDKAFKGEL